MPFKRLLQSVANPYNRAVLRVVRRTAACLLALAWNMREIASSLPAELRSIVEKMLYEYQSTPCIRGI